MRIKTTEREVVEMPNEQVNKTIHKKENGQFFTVTNPFFVSIFYKWFELIPEQKRETILEPFAGSNNIVKLINELSVGGKKPKKFWPVPSIGSCDCRK